MFTYAQIPNYYIADRSHGFTNLSLKTTAFYFEFDRSFDELAISMAIIRAHVLTLNNSLSLENANKLEKFFGRELKLVKENIIAVVNTATAGKTLLDQMNMPNSETDTNCKINIPLIPPQLKKYTENANDLLQKAIEIKDKISLAINSDSDKIAIKFALAGLSAINIYTTNLKMEVIDFVTLLRAASRLGKSSDLFIRRGKLLKKLDLCISEAYSTFEGLGCKRDGEGATCRVKMLQYLEPVRIIKLRAAAFNGCTLSNTYYLGEGYRVYVPSHLDNLVFQETEADSCLSALLSKKGDEVRKYCNLSNKFINAYELSSSGIVIQEWTGETAAFLSAITSEGNFRDFTEVDLPLLIRNTFKGQIGSISLSYNNEKTLNIKPIINQFTGKNEDNIFCPKPLVDELFISLYNKYFVPYKLSVIFGSIGLFLSLILFSICIKKWGKIKRQIYNCCYCSKRANNEIEVDPTQILGNMPNIQPRRIFREAMQMGQSMGQSEPHQQLAMHALRALLIDHPNEQGHEQMLMLDHIR